MTDDDLATDLAADPTVTRPAAGMPTRLAVLLAVAAAFGTSTIYLLQPAQADVGRSLGSGTAGVGAALSCGPVGYLIGLVLLVPLLDRVQPNRVLAAEFAALAAALALTATVRSVAVLAVLATVTGTCSVVGAGMSSLAGRLAAPHRRATLLGIVTAGISAGILAGRIVGGWLTDVLGWRGMLLALAAACAVLAGCCRAGLPTTSGLGGRGFLTTVLSLPGLYVHAAALRLAAVRGALWFFAFCATWAGLAAALAHPPYSYSAGRIGLYALAGLSGTAATQVAGRWTDRVGARRVILCGLGIAVLATVAVGLGLASTPVTVIALALFDAGLFTAQVANQSTVLAIDPSGPARYNGAYMFVYFVGGSLGTAFGPAAVQWFGWRTTELIAAAAVVAAAALTARSRQCR